VRLALATTSKQNLVAPLLTAFRPCYILVLEQVFFKAGPMSRASAKKLSDRQKRIIGFIGRFFTDKGYPPSIRDIQAGCKISSTSVVDYNLNILESRGYLERHADVSRGIKLLNREQVSEPVMVPVIGMIAAGEPIPVPTPDTWDIAAVSETMSVPRELTFDKKDIYALRVRGMSMIDALINDGDVVLMQHVDTVQNGEMAAVWLKEEKEVTLKKVYAEPDHVRLQPANEQMQPIFVAPDNVEIQGRVIAVIRRVS
jgi:repressor LexA